MQVDFNACAKVVTRHKDASMSSFTMYHTDLKTFLAKVKASAGGQRIACVQMEGALNVDVVTFGEK